MFMKYHWDSLVFGSVYSNSYYIDHSVIWEDELVSDLVKLDFICISLWFVICRWCRLVRFCPLVARQRNMAEQASADPSRVRHHVWRQAWVRPSSSLPDHRAPQSPAIPGEGELCHHDLLCRGRDLQGIRNQASGGAESHEVAVG